VHRIDVESMHQRPIFRSERSAEITERKEATTLGWVKLTGGVPRAGDVVH
jgi:hypothetical protein